MKNPKKFAMASMLAALAAMFFYLAVTPEGAQAGDMTNEIRYVLVTGDVQ